MNVVHVYNFLNPPVRDMLLRDYFAGQALAGFFAYTGAEHMNEATSDTADYCYKMADAMLAKRNAK